MRISHFAFLLLFGFVLFSCEPDVFTPSEDIEDIEDVEDVVNQEPEDPAETQTDFATAALDAVNQLRRQGCRCGNDNLPPVPELSWNNLLEKAALKHATDMRDQSFFSHFSSDGTGLGQRVTKEGYSWKYVGENIAFGYPSLEEVMQGWVDSPGHCRNLMSVNFTEIGLVELDGYWVQDFARPL